MSARGPTIVGVIAVLFLFHFSVFASEVVINEFLPAPSTGNPEWVELYNASDSADYLKFYYLDDDTSFDSDTGNSAKKVLINLNVTSPHFPFFVFTSAILNNDGDSVVLFDPSGTIVDQFTYYDNPGSDVVIGRYPDQTGQFTLVSTSTQGAGNTAPIPTSTPIPTLTPTNTPAPTSAPVNTPVPTATNTPIPTNTPTRKPTPTIEVTPTSIPSPTPAVLGVQDEKPQNNKPYIIALLFISIGCALLGAVFVIKNKLYLKR